ncbi:MAG: hypothetical protein HKN47_03490, partial [Pirellulaceae bacterium]|nr:hypothetical protein [Pirellulaceae bacterium]
ALGMARNAIGQDDWQLAREQLEQLDPISTEGQALLGRIYVHLGDFDGVEKWIARAADSGDQYADTWLVRGAYFAHQDQHADAVGCFSKALLIDQTDHVVYSLYSQSLKQLSFQSEAKEASRRAELLKETHSIGAKMAASEVRTDDDVSNLIDLLEELRRGDEALAWRRITNADESDHGSKSADSKSEQATRTFILCGVDVNELDGKGDSQRSEPDADRNGNVEAVEPPIPGQQSE